MQYTNADLRKALGIVHKYDPATYARMQRANWKLVATPQELQAVIQRTQEYWSYDQLKNVTSAADNANGVTLRKDETGLPWNLSIFNCPGLQNDAEGEGDYHDISDWHVLMAAVAVHEFRHVTQPSGMSLVDSEKDAFAADVQFARLLPAPDSEAIITWSRLAMGEELPRVRAGTMD